MYIAKKPDHNGYIHYTEEENQTWKQFYNRQCKVVENRACDAFTQGIDKLELNEKVIPQCIDINKKLKPFTGWQVTPVKALISFDEFFTLLSNKQFPAASFIRTPEDIDYLQEPDIFHELFGHCPLLTNQAFADFTHAVIL